MGDIPDALTLDNGQYLESVIRDSVKKIKANIISNIKHANVSAKCTCTVNITSFVPIPSQLGDDYQAVLMQVCEEVTLMLQDKNYKLETNVTNNGTYTITLSWKKKKFDGECPTFTRYMKKDQ